MKTQWKYFKAQIKGNEVVTWGEDFCLLGRQYNLAGYPKPGGTWAKWNYRDGELTIENDCLGFYPIYYYRDETQIVVSNSILKIIAEAGDVEIDKAALKMFVHRNYFLDDCTAYAKIKTLAPNSTIKWTKDSFSVDSHLLAVKPLNLNSEQIVDTYIELTKQAVARNLPDNEKFIMPLSGGRDSRMMLLELMERGYKPELCVTCGEMRDVKIAKQICDKLDLNHKVLHPRQRWVKDSVRKNVRISFSTLQHDWLMALGDFVRTSNMLSYDGNGVGMFSRNAYTDEGMKFFELFRAGKYEEVEDYAFPSNSPHEEYIEMLPDKFDYLKGGTNELRQQHLNNLFRYKIYPNDLSAFSFYSNTRTAISTCPYGIMYPAKIYCPLLDYDLFSFVAALTPEQVTENEPQAIAARKAYPEFADIPFYNELEYQKGPKHKISSMVLNIADLNLFITKFDAGNLIPLLKSKLGKPNQNNRSVLTRFSNLVLFLSMVEYCSKKKSAAGLLEWLDKNE